MLLAAYHGVMMHLGSLESTPEGELELPQSALGDSRYFVTLSPNLPHAKASLFTVVQPNVSQNP